MGSLRAFGVRLRLIQAPVRHDKGALRVSYKGAEHPGFGFQSAVRKAAALMAAARTLPFWASDVGLLLNGGVAMVQLVSGLPLNVTATFTGR